MATLMAVGELPVGLSGRVGLSRFGLLSGLLMEMAGMLGTDLWTFKALRCAREDGPAATAKSSASSWRVPWVLDFAGLQAAHSDDETKYALTQC